MINENKSGRIPLQVWPVLLAGILSGSFFLGTWYGLNVWFLVVLTGGMFLIVTEIAREAMKDWERQQRLEDTVIYMEQMLYAFRDTQKILNAMEDVLVLFPKGKMHRCLVWGMKLIHQRTDKGRAEELALHRIELEYPCGKMSQMHRFFLDVERLGGDFSNALDLIQRDCTLWEERAGTQIKLQKKYRRDVLLSILASIAICGIGLYLLPQKTDIRTYPLTQFTSTLFLLTDACIFLVTMKKAQSDIFEISEEDPYALKKYEKCQRFNEKKEQKLSFYFALCPLAMTVLFVAVQKWMLAGSCCLCAVFLLFQHRIGYLLAKRAVRRELAVAFPQWLMQLGLLLQGDNVERSIEKSRVLAPGILQPAIRQMVMELEYAPGSQEPFSGFLQEFKVTGVAPAMRMLYAIAAGSGTHPTAQMAAVIRRIQNEYDRVLRQKHADHLAGMYLLFLAPVVIGMLKLAADMAVFMVSCFNSITV